jgi:uncharacterized protein (DUF58 family)
VEFSEYREYAPGDDLKHFDWKAFAKSDKLLHQAVRGGDEPQVCHLLLDVSESMGYGSATITKLEYAATVAASLAHLLVRQQDSVGLVTLRREIESFLPPRSSREPPERDLVHGPLRAAGAREETGIGERLPRDRGAREAAQGAHRRRSPTCSTSRRRIARGARALPAPQDTT